MPLTKQIAIQSELNKAFPTITFKVTSESYYKGDPVFPPGEYIGVIWNDGPTQYVIEEIIEKYREDNVVFAWTQRTFSKSMYQESFNHFRPIEKNLQKFKSFNAAIKNPIVGGEFVLPYLKNALSIMDLTNGFNPSLLTAPQGA